ncbi:MAG: branched-chain amino acid ABC transporter permease [Clostridia bacterium]|nr:branched-chain amino acid ABC transporter permease [Deltaproteobacteria bacterium]
MRQLIPIACILILAALMHFGVMPLVGGFYGKLLMDIGINVILAVSLNVVNGFTGQFSIGHAGFMAVGAYVAATLTYYVTLRTGAGGQGLFFAACIAGGIVAGLAGWIVGLPSLRLRGDYLAIVTLGFGEILRVTLQRTGDVVTDAAAARSMRLVELTTHVGGALGFTGLPFYTNGFWVVLFAGIAVLAAARLKTSTHGRAFVAIRENEVAAEAMGVPTTRYKVQAFVVAAFFAGIAGALFAHEVGVTLNPRELGFQRSFDIVIMVVLGGLGSVTGSALAATALTIIPELLRGFAEYRLVVFALILIVVMIWRPQGLLGNRA